MVWHGAPLSSRSNSPRPPFFSPSFYCVPKTALPLTLTSDFFFSNLERYLTHRSSVSFSRFLRAIAVRVTSFWQLGKLLFYFVVVFVRVDALLLTALRPSDSLNSKLLNKIRFSHFFLLKTLKINRNRTLKRKHLSSKCTDSGHIHLHTPPFSIKCFFTP